MSSLITLVVQFLNSEGVSPDATSLAHRLKDVDISGGDAQGIAKAISTHLVEDLKLEQKKADEVVKKGQEMISSTVLPSLGVSVTSNGEEKKGREPVKITDVRDFKASLQVSRGPRAVKELSEFEDLESKL